MSYFYLFLYNILFSKKWYCPYLPFCQMLPLLYRSRLLFPFPMSSIFKICYCSLMTLTSPNNASTPLLLAIVCHLVLILVIIVMYSVQVFVVLHLYVMAGVPAWIDLSWVCKIISMTFKLEHVNPMFDWGGIGLILPSGGGRLFL